MAKKNNNRKKGTHYYMRTLHRDVGFFILGLIVIYSISGIVLTYRNTDFLKSERQVERQLEPNMEANELGQALRMRGFRVESEDAEVIDFGSGTYNKETGLASYTVNELPVVLAEFNELHQTISSNITGYFSAALGIALLFMAISSLWMFKPSSTHFKRGMVLTVVGIVFSVVILFL